MAQVFYEDKDITSAVEIEDLVVMDSCGDQADGIDAKFGNAENQWSTWSPQKEDALSIVNDGYRSGAMWIDRIRQENGVLNLGAVSIPPGGKTKRTKAWEKVTLITLAAEKAAFYGLSASFISAPTYVYDRVDQLGRGDFGFLQDRTRLEGCSIKIQDKKLYLFSDLEMERQKPVKTIDAGAFLEDPRFESSAGQTYSACVVAWKSISAQFADAETVGPVLYVSDTPVFSAGEGGRFAKNLLRSYNKKKMVGEISISLDTTISAGNVVKITGTGLNDGNYYIDTAQHSFAEEISRLSMHQCFTRY